MPDTVEIPFRIAYKMSAVSAQLSMPTEDVRRALITNQLEGRMTDGGRYLVLNRGLQTWIDRGRPLWAGDNALQAERAFRVMEREGQIRFSYRMSEAARLVSISQTFLATQAHLGYLHAKRAGGVYLIPKPALLEWIEQLHPVEYRPRGGWLPHYRSSY